MIKIPPNPPLEKGGDSFPPLKDGGILQLKAFHIKIILLNETLTLPWESV